MRGREWGVGKNSPTSQALTKYFYIRITLSGKCQNNPKRKKKVAQKQDRGLFLPDTLTSKELVHGHYNTPHGQGPKFCLVSQLRVIHDLRWFQVVLWRKKCSRRAYFFFQKILENCLTTVLFIYYWPEHGHITIHKCKGGTVNIVFILCVSVQLNCLLLWKKWRKTLE